MKYQFLDYSNFTAQIHYSTDTYSYLSSGRQHQKQGEGGSEWLLNLLSLRSKCNGYNVSPPQEKKPQSNIG